MRISWLPLLYYFSSALIKYYYLESIISPFILYSTFNSSINFFSSCLLYPNLIFKSFFIFSIIFIGFNFLVIGDLWTAWYPHSFLLWIYSAVFRERVSIVRFFSSSSNYFNIFNPKLMKLHFLLYWF